MVGRTGNRTPLSLLIFWSISGMLIMLMSAGSKGSFVFVGERLPSGLLGESMLDIAPSEYARNQWVLLTV
jgi:hypothetical protein